jgi:uncharacterized protein YidB (DUF937 family)
MGLLDSMMGSLGQGGTGNALLDGVLRLVNDPATGGLAGLVQTFQQRGLGGIVDSWVSTGQNLPISPEQLAQALGADRIGGLAQSLGVSQGDVASQLANLLPQVVDKLTPGGQLPQSGSADDLVATVRKMLG